MKAFVKECTCKQCKYVKNKRKNRKNKAIIKRLLNKQRRKLKDTDAPIIYYWA